MINIFNKFFLPGHFQKSFHNKSTKAPNRSNYALFITNVVPLTLPITTLLLQSTLHNVDHTGMADFVRITENPDYVETFSVLHFNRKLIVLSNSVWNIQQSRKNQSEVCKVDCIVIVFNMFHPVKSSVCYTLSKLVIST